MKRAAFVVIGLLVVVIAVAGCGTKVPGVPDPVAKVNGKAIPASTYLEQASRRFGQDLLRNMIEQSIVLQWAEEEKVPPTDEQINRQIDALKRDGAYDEQVKVLGEAGLKQEIAAMQARVNLARKDIEISKSDLQQTYDTMKQRYVHPPRKQVALIISSKQSDMKEAAKKAKSGEDFDKVAAEYSGQQYASFRGPMKFWLEENQPGMPPELAKATKETKLGEIGGPVKLAAPSGPTQYVVLKVIQEQPRMNKALKDVKAEVEDAALFQKSQSDPGFIEKLNERMKNAKIEVGISEFKNLAFAFKNPPEPPPVPMSAPQPAPKPAPKPATKN
jgi:hypothetical protein